MKLQQNVIDFAGKGILPITNNINVYGKLGVAYITSDIKGILRIPGEPKGDFNFNDQEPMLPNIKMGDRSGDRRQLRHYTQCLFRCFFDAHPTFR